MKPHVTVVCIGADGWDGLTEQSRAIVRGAATVFGGSRHLASLPLDERQVRVPWPSPMRPAIPTLLSSAQAPVVVIASGDPLVSGVGATLLDEWGHEHVTIVPAVSSVSLARARMGWSAEGSAVVSLVGRHLRLLVPALSAGRRLLVLSSDESTPALVAALLDGLGWGATRMTVLGDLGAPHESVASAEAHAWPDLRVPRLHVLALEVRGVGPGWGVGGILPDDALVHEGQITKRDLRASAVARLAPAPGQLLWDVGAGSGSISIEWMRTWASARAIAIEPRPDRVALIRANADRFGVPSLRVVEGRAPEACRGLPAPDAVFVGGGGADRELLDVCWEALRPGGRIVVHAVTAETEAELVDRYCRLGGELIRLSIERAEPLGTFTGWRPARAVSQWAITKGES